MTTFSYIGKETKYISKLFKHTKIEIAHRMNNSIEQNQKSKAETTNTCFASGIYKCTCLECGTVYVGQTDINFSKGYTEHH